MEKDDPWFIKIFTLIFLIIGSIIILIFSFFIVIIAGISGPPDTNLIQITIRYVIFYLTLPLGIYLVYKLWKKLY